MALFSMFLGLSILIYRLWPLMEPKIQAKSKDGSRPGEKDQFRLFDAEKAVSLIIPCRNEETNLPELLSTLRKIHWKNLELILIDDQSTDSTLEILRTAQVPNLKLVEGKARPEGWAGKNWACHQGAAVATGEILIFSDADTRHHPSSVERLVQSIEDLDLCSVAPVHITPSIWEKCMGPFYLFSFIAGAGFHKAHPSRFYAIGQYLAFRRAWYFERSNHEMVKEYLCEDMEMVKRSLESQGRYKLLISDSEPIYQVRMYQTLFEFLKGWRRIFRLGFGYSNFASFIEIYFLVALFSLSFAWSDLTAPMWLLWFVGIAVGSWACRHWGDYPMWSFVFWPVALALFVGISVVAGFDHLMRRKILWRGRAYEGIKAS